MFCRPNRGTEGDAEEAAHLRVQAETYRQLSEKHQQDAEKNSREVSRLLLEIQKIQAELKSEKSTVLSSRRDLEDISNKLNAAEVQNETLRCGFVAIDAKYGELQQRYETESREARLKDSRIQEQTELRERLERRIAELEEDLRRAPRRRASDADGTDTSQADEDVLRLPVSSSCTSNERLLTRPRSGDVAVGREVASASVSPIKEGAKARVAALEVENAALKDRIVFLVARWAETEV
jgi:chromosome segregation ATPase